MRCEIGVKRWRHRAKRAKSWRGYFLIPCDIICICIDDNDKNATLHLKMQTAYFMQVLRHMRNNCTVLVCLLLMLMLHTCGHGAHQTAEDDCRESSRLLILGWVPRHPRCIEVQRFIAVFDDKRRMLDVLLKEFLVFLRHLSFALTLCWRQQQHNYYAITCDSLTNTLLCFAWMSSTHEMFGNLLVHM